jgi:hypothetical protein
MEDASYGLHGKTVHGQVTMVVINKHGTGWLGPGPAGKGDIEYECSQTRFKSSTEHRVQSATGAQGSNSDSRHFISDRKLDLIQLVIHTSVGPMFIYKETR